MMKILGFKYGGRTKGNSQQERRSETVSGQLRSATIVMPRRRLRYKIPLLLLSLQRVTDRPRGSLCHRNSHPQCLLPEA